MESVEGLEARAALDVLDTMGREKVEARTPDSATFVYSDGSRHRVVSTAPLHAEGSNGSLERIQGGLVEAEAGWVHTGGQITVELPRELADGVTVASERGAVTVRLRDVDSAHGVVDGHTVTYTHARKGMDVVLAVVDGGVRLDVMVADGSADRQVIYDIDMSDSLVLVETEDGEVLIRDPAGAVLWHISEPSLREDLPSADDRSAPVQLGMSTEEGDETAAITIPLDADWLDAPGRQGPVTMSQQITDPEATLGWEQGISDFLLGQSAPFEVGSFHWSRYRYYLRLLLHLRVAERFDTPVVINNASLHVHATNPVDELFELRAAPLATSWEPGHVSWTHAGPGTPWAQPGGDLDHTSHRTATVPPGQGEVTLDITPWVREWTTGTRDDAGIILYEPAVDPPGFTRHRLEVATHADGGSDPAPVLHIHYEELPHAVGVTGREAWVSATSMQLPDGSELAVGHRNGNLTVAAGDMSLPGTGIDARYERFFNSADARLTDVGRSWNAWPGTYSGLEFPDPDTIVFQYDRSWTFTRAADGTWTAPPGSNAVLSEDAGGWVLWLPRNDITWAFAATGQLTAITDRNGNTVSIGYDGGAVTSVTDTQGRVTLVERDGDGMVTVVDDPAGRRTTYTYDDRQNLTVATDPAGHYVSYVYDSDDRLVRVTFPNGGDTVVVYDEFGRVASVGHRAAPGGPLHTTSFAYEEDQTVVTDPAGHPTTYLLDDDGRATGVIDALGRQRATTYSPNNDVATTTNPYGSVTTVNSYSDDGLFNLTGVASPTASGDGASALETLLDYEGEEHSYKPTTIHKASGSVIHYGYDPAGNANCVRHGGDVSPCAADPGGQGSTWRFEHNPDGTVSARIDPRGNITAIEYTYTGSGQLRERRVIHPAPRQPDVETFDAIGRLIARIDGNGNETSYAYDLLDRLVRIDAADGLVVTMDYDAVGNLLSREDATGPGTMTYDLRSRLVSEANPGAPTISYVWDEVGNLASYADNHGTVTYTYDAIRRPISVTDPGSGDQTTTITYFDDVDGRHDQRVTTYPNGVTSSELVDQGGRLTSIDGTSASGQVLTSFVYDYEADGDPATALRSAVVDHNDEHTAYAYDDLDRLTGSLTTSAAGDTLDQRTWDYDAAGNRIRQDRNGQVFTYDYNAANQMTRAASTSYYYDDAGNMTGNSATMSLGHNASNQVTEMSQGTTTLDASYRGATNAERASIGTINEYTSSILGVIGRGAVRYTRAPDGTLISRRTQAARAYYLFDGLGSISALVDAAGIVRNRYAYHPFGETTQTCPTGSCLSNPWRFTGAYQDATGFYKMGHRYYIPFLGRWTQPDPLERDTNPTNPTEAHPYVYAGCDPINYTDASGLCAVEYGLLIAALVGQGFAIAATGLSLGMLALANLAALAGVYAAFSAYHDCIMSGGTVF